MSSDMPSYDRVCFPLADPQRRLLGLLGTCADPSAYVSFLAHHVRGPLDLPRLRRAMDALTARHEPLRTAFPADEDGTVRRQCIEEPDAMPWELTVLDTPPVPSSPPPLHSEEDALLQGFARRAFDLARGPLARVLVVRRAAEDHLVVLAVHLLAADGWSLQILLDELGEYYADAGRATALLPPLDIQYADWAHWQAGRAARPEGPRIPARPVVGPGRRLRTAPVPVSAAERLARQEGVPLFTVLLTAFALAARGPAAPRVMVDVPVSGRDHPQLAVLAGYFTRFHRLAVSLPDDITFRQAMRRVQGAWAEAEETDAVFARPARPHTSTGLAPDSVLADGVPLFSYRASDVQPRLRLEGCSVTEADWLHNAAKVDLGLITDLVRDAVHPVLEFRPSVVPERVAERLGRNFAVLLEGAAADPDETVDPLEGGVP
ncbi:condensation domain-containing protein [Streptomyces sp. NPDC127092]|uniref:condensation domain-containing protein n=1 Tax=Streptomyces sp. NPDC127092 TaxID=3347135 RepID=UPI00365B8FA4